MTGAVAEDRDGSVLHVLRHPEFRHLWSGSVILILGNMLVVASAAWLMAEISGDPLRVALVQASLYAPVMTLSLISGVFADSVERKSLLLLSLGVKITAVSALALLAASGTITPGLLLALILVVGVGSALHFPAWQATIGDLVPRAEIPSAVALNNIAHNLARCLGPGVSGALLVWLSVSAAFTIGVVCFLASGLRVIRWRPSRTLGTGPRDAFLDALRAGFGYAASTPRLAFTIGRCALFAFGAIQILALMPVVVKTLPGGTAVAFGLVLGAFGAGALASGLASRRLRTRLGAEGLVRAAFAAAALGAILISQAQSVWQAALAASIAGAGWVAGFSTFNSTTQMSVARWVVGRIMSVHQTALFGGLTLGSFCGGALASTWSADFALLSAAAVLMVGAGLGAVSAVIEPPDDTLDPLGRFTVPALDPAQPPPRGPVHVEISYRVPASDRDAFLAEMAPRARARRRDGARRWHLLQDLADPLRWTERYEVADWGAYLRHNERQTMGDLRNLDALRHYHEATSSPAIRRMVRRRPQASALAHPS